MVPKKIRVKVLKAFSENLDGQIVTGHPEHPDEEGRYVYVTEAGATALEDAKLGKRYSLKDEARDEIAAENRGSASGGDDPADAGSEGGANVQGARTAGTGARKSAQAVREQRSKPQGRGKAKAPVGGNETNASTNHGKKATSGGVAQAATDTNMGANAVPDPDAAP